MKSKQQQFARLRPEIGLLQLFSLSFGMIIGVGWITLLGFWIADAGPIGSVVAFFLGALLLVPVGLCYAEMIGIFPTTGGPIVYCYKILGVSPAYWAGWMILMTSVPVIALQGISLGWIIDALLPGVRGPFLYSLIGSDVHIGDLVVGLGGLAIIGWVNWSGGGVAGRTQEMLTAALLASVLVLWGASLFRGDPGNLSPEFALSNGNSIWTGVLAVLVTTPFLLSGFEAIAQGVGERREGMKARNAALVIVAAIAAATVFYVLVILAASSVAPRADLLAAELPTARAFEVGLGSPSFAKIALLGGACGIVTSWNGSIFVAQRVLLVLGRAHLLWPGFARGTGTKSRPTQSALFVAALSLIGILLGRNAVLPLVIASSVFIGLTFLLVTMCVIADRLRSPNRERPFRIVGGITIPILGTVSALVITALAIAEPWVAAPEQVPVEAWITVGSVVLGLIFWISGRGWRNRITEDERQRHLFTD